MGVYMDVSRCSAATPIIYIVMHSMAQSPIPAVLVGYPYPPIGYYVTVLKGIRRCLRGSIIQILVMAFPLNDVNPLLLLNNL